MYIPSHDQKPNGIWNRRIIQGFVFFLVLLLPVAIQMGPPVVRIFGILWALNIWRLAGPEGGLYLQLWVWSDWTLFVVLPLSFLRFIFVLQIGRYYVGKTTRFRTLSFGLLAEIQMAIIWYSLALYYTLRDGVTPYPLLLVPTPLVFFITWLIIRWYPPSAVKQGQT
jgi:cytochrome c oxidase subunit IV